MSYSNPAYSVLAAVLASVLSGTPYQHVGVLLHQRLMEPLGVPREAWLLDYGQHLEWRGHRISEVAGGARYTARAVARLGQLFLGEGRWGGRQILARAAFSSGIKASDALLPPNWREERFPVPALGWWLNTKGAWRSAPADTMIGAGAGHRVVVVIPSLDLVAVRLGRQMGRSSFGGDYWTVLEDGLLTPLAAAIRA